MIFTNRSRVIPQDVDAFQVPPMPRDKATSLQFIEFIDWLNAEFVTFIQTDDSLKFKSSGCEITIQTKDGRSVNAKTGDYIAKKIGSDKLFVFSCRLFHTIYSVDTSTDQFNHDFSYLPKSFYDDPVVPSVSPPEVGSCVKRCPSQDNDDEIAVNEDLANLIERSIESAEEAKSEVIALKEKFHAMLQNVGDSFTMSVLKVQEDVDTVNARLDSLNSVSLKEVETLVSIINDAIEKKLTNIIGFVLKNSLEFSKTEPFSNKN